MSAMRGAPTLSAEFTMPTGFVTAGASLCLNAAPTHAFVSPLIGPNDLTHTDRGAFDLAKPGRSRGQVLQVAHPIG